jgi:protein-disulfide isomerase
MGRILEIEEREYGGDHGSRQLAVASHSTPADLNFLAPAGKSLEKRRRAIKIGALLSVRPARQMKRYLPFAIVLGVLLIAVGAGVFFIQQRRQQPPPITGAGVPGAEPSHTRGPATALVSLEEFGDFECMPCYILFPVLKNLENDYADNVSFTFREHPLMAQHRNALEAARAAEAAGLQGQFWQMHEKLYLNRAVWVPALDVRGYLTTYATYLGLDVARFKKDMDGEEVARRIKADQARGASLGVDRTPVVFINGQKIAFGASPDADMRAAIDKALAEKREH